MKPGIFRVFIVCFLLNFSISAFAEMPGESRYHQYELAKELVPQMVVKDLSKLRGLEKKESLNTNENNDLSKLKEKYPNYKNYIGDIKEPTIQNEAFNLVDFNNNQGFQTDLPSLIADKQEELTEAEKAPKEATFGYVSQGGSSTEINWLRYKLMLSDKIAIPIYFISTKTNTDDSTKQVEQLSNELLNNRAGEINLKYASDKKFDFNGKDKKGAVCDFTDSKAGGCYFAWELGVKTVKFSDAEKNDKYAYAIYAGIGIDLEFPIYKVTQNPENTPAGNLIFGSSLNTLYTQSDKLNDVFLRDGRTVKLEKDYVVYNDTHASFFITEVIAVEAGYVHSFQNDALKNDSYVKFKYSKAL